MKPDLGALLVGMLLANHPKAAEMAKTLLNFKELLLVVFFLNIGLSGLPTQESVLMAALLLMILPIKALLYHLILTFFHLRSRTALLATSTLTNYSEFGLIVGAVGVTMGVIDQDWVTAIALALTGSFIIASVVNSRFASIYLPIRTFLKKIERQTLHVEDHPMQPGDAQIIILGMGRVGTGAYGYLNRHQEKKLLGVELNHDRVDGHKALDRNVIQGDATDSEFWEKARMSHKIELVLLAMPLHHGNVYATERLLAMGYDKQIAAIASHEDDAEELRQMGVDVVFNFYSEAGAGFAEHICKTPFLKH